jgi:hypothetical protein
MSTEYFIELVDDIWVIVERATDMVIDGSYQKEEAKEKCKFFNSGGGFAGWTPMFMIGLDLCNAVKT